MCVLTDGGVNRIPPDAVLISDNRISKVWANSTWVFKRSIPFLIENELGMLTLMQQSGFTPIADRYDKYTLMIENVGESQKVVNAVKFKERCASFLSSMRKLGVRHGDLTTPHIIVRADFPFVIDWAESRYSDDPRPDKRPEGDEYWLNRSIEELCR